ncbi:GDP-fucose protein O-fucosyltransferase [Carex littledalei]|uniref:O-fucosyltransferase family protein n=1 Tax=Carex littledalei TaxID=544730 RepID=A0A833QWN3_9POAL|nr:GDP-fucose protein O-fucosyltransferase [Carex littledalei]
MAVLLAQMLRGRLRVCFLAGCCGVLLWACVLQLLSLGRLWCCSWTPTGNSPPATLDPMSLFSGFGGSSSRLSDKEKSDRLGHTTLPPPRMYKSNGYLRVSCNGGLNQMRSEICDMVAIARLLNLTLVVPELDKISFWADQSNFDDIFDVRYFIDSLRDEVRIIKRLPKRFNKLDSSTSSNSTSINVLTMAPVSWSDEKYYLQQILPLFKKFKVVHFNKTDARLANNGINLSLQKLRCRVNFHALKFTPAIKELGDKLVQAIRKGGSYVALHLRYEMDMLAFSGCNHGCSPKEAEELKRMRYAYPWWREKEIDSKAKRLQGLCPLTPEETSIILKAFGFDNSTQIYIAAGETYGGQERIRVLEEAFPYLLRKEMLVEKELFSKFQNHSSQMAAIDFMVSVASDVFIPTYDGNMAKVVEGYRRYQGYQKSILLDRRKLVELVDLYENKTLSWDEFAKAVQQTHQRSLVQPACRRMVPNKPKEEDYFYANPFECLSNVTGCVSSG